MYRHLIIFCLVAVVAVSFKQPGSRAKLNNDKLSELFQKNKLHSFHQFFNSGTDVRQTLGNWMDKHMKKRVMKMALQQLISTEKQEKGSWKLNRKRFLSVIKDVRNELEKKKIFNKKKTGVSELKKKFQMEMSWFNRII